MYETRQQLLEFALDVARRAGDRTLLHFRGDLQVESKADASPVTIADRDAEQLARELISERFPDDGIVGEEFGRHNPEAPRRWILDPIDGTRSFVQGVPLYGVLVAVEEDREAIIGVIHFPALDESVYAAAGEGCWCDGAPARVSEVASVPDAVVLCTNAEELEQRSAAGWNTVRHRARMVRTWGDCYGHALVATGRAEAMVEPVMHVWDCAALQPILEEAGGRCTDWSGAATIHSGNLIGSNGRVHGELLGLIAG